MAGRIDVSELRRLERHLARVAPQAQRDMRAVVIRGSMNIKQGWRQNAAARAPKHAPHFPRSIGYDLYPLGRDDLLSVIGPDKGGPQGALGNILEHGTVKNPPQHNGYRALLAELPAFEAHMQLIVQRGLAWW